MSIFIFLTVVQALVGAALVGVILMQRSEGGGLGVGSSSASFMSARGAADFLTRSTAVLATIFVLLSIVLAALAASGTESRKIDTSLDRSAPAVRRRPSIRLQVPPSRVRPRRLRPRVVRLPPSRLRPTIRWQAPPRSNISPSFT